MKFKIDCIFGHVEIKGFSRIEEGRMVTYGYSITYGEDGTEVSRTEPSAIGSIEWGDGSPFTEEDAKEFS